MKFPPSARADGRPGDYQTLVLGIGNVLWADEGFGIRAAEQFNARYTLPDSARLMDGGTQGIFLLPWVRHARRLLIFDAVDFGLPSGTLKLVRGADVPCFMGAKKVSMHQAGFQEVLSTAALTGDLPEELALIGVQPEVLDDYGGSLTPTVRAQIRPALDIAVQLLEYWGVPVAERDVPVSHPEFIGPDALAISDYENGRPKFPGELP